MVLIICTKSESNLTNGSGQTKSVDERTEWTDGRTYYTKTISLQLCLRIIRWIIIVGKYYSDSESPCCYTSHHISAQSDIIMVQVEISFEEFYLGYQNRMILANLNLHNP